MTSPINYSSFTNRYSVAKTLKFELKPIGKTLENIHASGILEIDEKRAENYKIFKNIIDKWHKNFIEHVLSTQNIIDQDHITDEISLDNIDQNYDQLREKVATMFSSHKDWEHLKSAKTLVQHLSETNTDENESLLIEDFLKFSSYLTGFMENRNLLYTKEEKHGTISYRIVHENLPRFLGNLKIIEIAKNEVPALNTIDIPCRFPLSQSEIESYNAIIGGYSTDDGIKIQGINELIYEHRQKTGIKLALAAPLYKMILSDRESLSWIAEKFKSDSEMLDATYEITKKMEPFVIELGKLISDEPASENFPESFKNQCVELVSQYVSLGQCINKGNIKNKLDSIKSLQHNLSDHLKENKNYESSFRSSMQQYAEKLDEINVLYNMVRNYMTKKPYNIEKYKLNFNCATLMSGWDVNKESSAKTFIFKKDNLFYLGIATGKTAGMFDSEPQQEEDCYEKMMYKLLPGPNKMLPKVFFANGRSDLFAPSEDMLKKYKAGTHLKNNPNFSLEDCHSLIDFFKASINKNEDWKVFNFKFSPTEEYTDISAFYKEISEQGYKITFQSVSSSRINELINTGKMHLFQIYSKDFSKHSHGKPNLHTLYWKMLFDNKNMSNIVYKLSGEGELFYRKSTPTLKKSPTHPANVPMANKNPNNPRKERTLGHDVVKDRRFTIDTFHFHVPITMNYKASGKGSINPMVVSTIESASETPHVIGIDRGERNLLYMVVLDPNGKIVESQSLNEITTNSAGFPCLVDYRSLLSDREKARNDSRLNWGAIKSIKDLKSGYMSAVVNIIAKTMIKYNAVLVMEDLNMGFKQSRQKIESSVYQKFEKAIIDKLNYFADKDANPEQNGGLLNAYQLTNKFESFEKMGKQNGFLFYVPATYTSAIDPSTGFANMFSFKYENVEKTKKIIDAFDSISYDSNKDMYAFKFDYKTVSKVAPNVVVTNSLGTQKTNWTVYSNGTRIETSPVFDKNTNRKTGKFEQHEVSLTEEFKKLFMEIGLNAMSINKEDVVKHLNEKSHCECFVRLFRLMMKLRNSMSNASIDYIKSPVLNKSETFFDSRFTDGTNFNGINNSDANGAYNIARKGIMLMERIRKPLTFESNAKFTCAIKNSDWFNYCTSFC